MAKRKAKPATAGPKMLLITCAGHKRAIARAVKKERMRCAAIALDCHMSQADRWESYTKIRYGVKP